MLRMIAARLLLATLVSACSNLDDGDPQDSDNLPTLDERIDECDRLFPPESNAQSHAACTNAAMNNLGTWGCYIRHPNWAAALLESVCVHPSMPPYTPVLN
jgi:hypothetical protein